MDTKARIILVLLFIAYSGFRLVRYLRYGLSRRASAVPPSALGVFPVPASAPGISSVPAPGTAAAPSGSSRVLDMAVMVVVWGAANAALWAALFWLPIMVRVPVIWRLFIGVFANFYLIPYSRRMGERRKHWMQSEPGNIGGS
jgi:hypothetical protein